MRKLARVAGSIMAAVFLFCLVGQASWAAGITVKEWGTTAKGQKVELYTLTGKKGLEAHITNFGGVLVSLMVPDRTGQKSDILLGYDDLASYEKSGFYGAIIGRYVNRIGSGGTFPLNGKTVQLERGNPNQKAVNHGGTWGFHKQLWQATPHDGSEPSLTLTLVSPDGAGGFPGQLTATVIYTVTKNNSLRIEYRASTDAPTVANLTNHAYFALQGQGNGDVSDERLTVYADNYTPADTDSLPTGAIEPVAGTPLDFRKPTRLGDILSSDFPQIAMRKGLDINLVLQGRPGKLRPAARLEDPKSGRVLEVLTTQPGLQLYSDNVPRPSTGKEGKTYGNWFSMSFETQHFPDSPNHPNFPSTILVPGKPLHETTVFKFSTE